MSEPQTVIPRADNDGGHSEIEKELEQALLLVRVSTMKMLRLQLAIERRDRAVALEAVEDLIDLDVWMAHSSGRSADAELMEAIAQEVDDQRSALLHEKFGLAAGLVKGPQRGWAQAGAKPAPAAAAEANAEKHYDFLGPVEAVIEEEPAVRRRRWWLIVALVMILLGALAGAVLNIWG